MSRPRRPVCCALLLAWTAWISGTVGADDGAKQGQAVVQGLDHLVIVVESLERSSRQFQALGFTLKPGRIHDNGIRNRHIKFVDGTEIELLTVGEPVDALTREYAARLRRHGDGPVFLALFAPDLDALSRRLDAGGWPYRRQGRWLDFPPDSELRPFFFGPRNRSTTDRPEHFAHANGARSLESVTIRGPGLVAVEALMRRLGARVERSAGRTADASRRVLVAQFAEGNVVGLPGTRHGESGELQIRFVGATLRTESLSAAVEALRAGGVAASSAVTSKERRLVVDPSRAAGLQLEFRPQR